VDPRATVCLTAYKTLDRCERSGVLPLCPLLRLDIDPQCFFNDWRTSPHAPGFLELVDRFDHLGRKVCVHQNPASSSPALSMRANEFLTRCFGYTTHSYM
jgi:hypothetical protein